MTLSPQGWLEAWTAAVLMLGSSFCSPIFHVTFKWSEVWSANTKMINIQRAVLRGFRGLSKWQLLPNRNGRKRSQFFLETHDLLHWAASIHDCLLTSLEKWEIVTHFKLQKLKLTIWSLYNTFKTLKKTVLEVRCTQVCRVDFLLSKVHFHLLHGGRWDRSHLWPQFGRSVS